MELENVGGYSRIGIQKSFYVKEEMETQRAYFQQLFDRAPLAIVLQDSNMKVININKSFEDLFGFTAEEIKGKIIDNLIVPEEKMGEAIQVSRRGLEGEVINIDTIRKKQDGTPVDVSLLGFPIKLNENRVGYFAIYSNITEQKRLERKLRESKNKIEQLHKIAIEMDKCQNEEEIYNLTIDAGERILDFDFCSLDIAEGDMLIVKATSSAVPENGARSTSINQGLVGKAFRTGNSILTDNIFNDSDARPVKSEYRAAITVPISNFGVFQVISTRINDFSKEDLKLAELLVSHTATALKRIRTEKKIRYLGFHDKLTGLYNRTYIEEEITRLDSERQLPLSIIVGDVNGLKLVNDAFGHKEGDKILKKVADVLLDSCRREDIIGRWGGDEFLIILPQTLRQEAEKVIMRIKENARQTEAVIPVSIALGVTTKNDINQNIIEVIKKADDFMYDDKMCETISSRSHIIKQLLARLGMRKGETREHSERVKEMAQNIACKIGLSKSEIEKIKMAASLHDIGLLNIPIRILNKEGDLTEEEWQLVKTHPETGYRIARSADEFAHIAEGILYHHEWWNGEGYPRGINGKEIPLASRIISIVDAFDIMTHDQIYKKAVSGEEARDELMNKAGIQFDPELVKIFVNELF